MAGITFSKTGMTTLTLSRGRSFPVSAPLTFHQIRTVSEAQTVRIATMAPPTQYIRVVCQFLTQDEADALLAWFQDGTINGGAATFTLTDEAGTDYEVRLWQDTLEIPQTSLGFSSVDLLLRVDAA